MSASSFIKVYELAKGMGLKCTVVTYGVLIKALLRSGKKQLQETSFEILRTLPDMGISPGVEVYNQFLEHFARTHDYRQVRIRADLIFTVAFIFSVRICGPILFLIIIVHRMLVCCRPRRCCG